MLIVVVGDLLAHTSHHEDGRQTCQGRPLYTRGWLLVLSIGLPLVEALTLQVVGTHPAQALAPQATAVAPFGVFHDLRWLLVFHPSWLAFGVELAGLIAVRTAITALLVRTAWPDEVSRPSPARLVGGSFVFTVVSAAVLAPFAAVLLGMAVVSLSWLFFVAVPSLVVVAALLHHGAVVSSWWRERAPNGTIGWVLLSFLVLTLASGVIVLTPGPVRLLAVVATGLFNAWAWNGIVHALGCRQRSPRFVPLAPVGIGVLMGVIAVGVSAGFSAATRDHALGPDDAPARARDGRPVLRVSGFGSEFDATEPDNRLVRRFSYAGLDTTGEPRPYEGDDTYQGISRSVALMSDQVEAFAEAVDRPITIVAESEGALVAKTYLMSHDEAPVDMLVLLSPLVEPGGAYYPPAGQDGWGVAGGWGLRGIAAAVRVLTPLEVSTDDGLFRSLVDDAPALRGLLACPVEGVEQLVLFSLADAVAGAAPQLDGLHSAVVPAFHGGLADDAGVQRAIDDTLAGDPPSGFAFWETAATVIGAGATAWRVPTLPLSINPAWEGADDVADCDQIADIFTTW
jgi:hypothetical protein